MPFSSGTRSFSKASWWRRQVFFDRELIFLSLFFERDRRNGLNNSFFLSATRSFSKALRWRRWAGTFFERELIFLTLSLYFWPWAQKWSLIFFLNLIFFRLVPARSWFIKSFRSMTKWAFKEKVWSLEIQKIIAADFFFKFSFGQFWPRNFFEATLMLHLFSSRVNCFPWRNLAVYKWLCNK